MKRDTKQIGTTKVKCFGKKRPKPDLKNTKKLKTIRSQKKQAQKHQQFKNVCSKKQKQVQTRKKIKNICSKKQAQKRKKKKQNSTFE